MEVLKKDAQHATAISQAAGSKARTSFGQKAAHQHRGERLQILESNTFQVGIERPEVMHVLLKRPVAETSFLAEIREK